MYHPHRAPKNKSEIIRNVFHGNKKKLLRGQKNTENPTTPRKR